MIRVVVVDDQPLVRAGIVMLVNAEEDITVVAEATHSDEVLPALAGHRCDVLLLDLSLPGRGGLEVLAAAGPAQEQHAAAASDVADQTGRIAALSENAAEALRFRSA